jgi:hypothetical protein
MGALVDSSVLIAAERGLLDPDAGGQLPLAIQVAEPQGS